MRENSNEAGDGYIYPALHLQMSEKKHSSKARNSSASSTESLGSRLDSRIGKHYKLNTDLLDESASRAIDNLN